MKNLLKNLFNKSGETHHGITLIALIITVIILLILSAVTINITIGGDLFGKTEKAVDDTNDKVSQLQNDSNDLLNQWDNLGSGTQVETPPEEPETPIDPELDRTYLSVGDYVEYTPDTAGAYSLSTAVSGYSSAQSISQETSLNWRILTINSDGTVDLISDVPTTTNVYFSSSIGYNNCVYVLNDICKTQYSNSTLAAVGRSLNLEDIEKNFNDSRNSCKRCIYICWFKIWMH